MAHVSFALFEVSQRGVSVEDIAERLNLPAEWVRERIEAARLCLKLDYVAECTCAPLM
jgi:DNA-directed RNA polymerase specialized sigma24 family protein